MTDTIPFAGINSIRDAGRARGDEMEWPEIMDHLISAVALMITAELPDPMDGKAVDTFLEEIKDQTRRKVDAIVLAPVAPV